MTAFSYLLRIGGIRIRILSPRSLCLPDNFLPFLTDEDGREAPDWVFEVVFGTPEPSLTESGSARLFGTGEAGGYWRVLLPDQDRYCRLYVPEAVEKRFARRANWPLFFMIEHLLLPYQRIILHASAVIWEGEAILFTAPSGTGKSTQAALWEAYADGEIINGDKVIVSADDDRSAAYGGPVAGTSGIYKNLQAPLRVIVYLHQGEENRLTVMDRRHAFMALYSQAVKSEDEAGFNEALIPLIERIVDRVPVVDYFCQPNASAVEYLRDRLSHIPHYWRR